MKPDGFRRLALSFPDAAEKAHMNHPDFRVGGKIFATLSFPTADFGMVKLTPEQQEEFVHDLPEVFVPVPGGWGRQGCTHMRLKAAKNETLHRAMEAAWRNAAAKVSPKKQLKVGRKGLQ